jgi:hypothetical protein
VSDEISVSVSGTSSVLTSEILDRARDLERLRDELRVLVARVVGADLLVSAQGLHSATAPASSYAAENDLDLGGALLAEAANRADLLAHTHRVAAGAYGAGETVKERALDLLAAQIGYGVGFFFPALVGATALPALAAATGFIVGAGGMENAAAVGKLWLQNNNRLITDPGFCALLHQASKSVDDLLAGLAHVPVIGQIALGDEGGDLGGDDMSAALIVLAGGGIGLFGEGKVSVTKTGESSVTAPPSGLSDRITRIPKTGENGGSQITIEKYVHADGSISWEAYFSGTQDFSPSNTTTPFDMSSNLRMMGRLPAGSFEAAEEALRQAGVKMNEPIVFTGHSQGALLAHELASSGKYRVTGVVEIGGPVSGSSLPTGANGVAIVHTDDIVPALGLDRPVDENEVVVERQAFAGASIPHDEAVPAHNRDRYLETAALADASARAELVRARNGMDAASSNAITMTSTTYKAVREAKSD